MAERNDLTGHRFGMLTALHPAETKTGRPGWAARCDCGKTTVAQTEHLRSGLTKSCGCGRGGKRDLAGQRFGRLVVVAYLGMRGKKNAYWQVRCDCGEERAVQPASLLAGTQKSCGCLSREKATKHGMEGTKVYSVWASMLQRCRNPKHHAYPNYGGRGISVCERWLQFEAFYADMGEPTGVLDRIDNDSGYSPTNCRWATWSTSNKNQRRHMNKKEA